MFHSVCHGLKSQWKSEVEFPVNPGTEVEVTCSDLLALKTGSKVVTCVSEKDYKFEVEPTCSLCDVGKQPNSDKTQCGECLFVSFMILWQLHIVRFVLLQQEQTHRGSSPLIA